MSKGSSHQQLEEDVEEDEQREKFKFEDEFGKQKCNTVSGEETSGKCSEPETQSRKLEETQEKHTDHQSQAIITVTAAGQECTNLSASNKR
ncbi:hypothetical protein ABG768_003756 [Culter alburnus]|uniref:Uncharacterized protein n=1 Tax=Culter alburnus TaxID=194366 RepID=A0AAW2A0T7_CULAL